MSSLIYSALRDEKIAALVGILNPSDFEPFIRRASEDFYEHLLTTVQNYLRENAEWNLKGEIEQSQASARYAQKRLAEVSEALAGVMGILGRAESNASGNPEWGYVGPRVKAAREALTNASWDDGFDHGCQRKVIAL